MPSEIALSQNTGEDTHTHASENFSCLHLVLCVHNACPRAVGLNVVFDIRVARFMIAALHKLLLKVYTLDLCLCHSGIFV